MSEITIYCIIFAVALLLLAYILSRPDTKARMKVLKEEREQTRLDEESKYYYYEKRIRELENEVEMLQNQLDSGYRPQTQSNNTLLWLVIIGLVAFLVYQGVQLNEYNQIKGMIEAIF